MSSTMGSVSPAMSSLKTVKCAEVPTNAILAPVPMLSMNLAIVAAQKATWTMAMVVRFQLQAALRVKEKPTEVFVLIVEITVLLATGGTNVKNVPDPTLFLKKWTCGTVFAHQVQLIETANVPQ